MELPIINRPGAMATMDDEDVNLLEGHPLRINDCGNVYIIKGSKTIYVRRIVMGFPDRQVTMCDGNSLNLQKSNLVCMAKHLPKSKGGWHVKTHKHTKPIWETTDNQITDSRIVVQDKLDEHDWDEETAPTIQEIRSKSSMAVKLAILLLGNTASEAVIEAQARVFMDLSQEALESSLQRFVATEPDEKRQLAADHIRIAAELLQEE